MASFVAIVIVVLLVTGCAIDAKIKTDPKTNYNNQILGPMKESDDAIFNFVSKLLTTVQKSSQIAANRAKNAIEKRRKLTDEINDILTEISKQ